nr:hypothetical protein BaRGS_021172 [Batillaria attramentaria]
MLAVMNGSHSNYDSDLFTPLFDTIQKASGAPAYSGRVGADDAAGVDMAYRVLADHARMYTVAITDGLMPSRHGLGHKLRQLIYRCVRYTQKVFHTDPHLLCVLVDLVADSLGAAYPEIQQRKELVKAAVAITTENYLQLQKEARQSFQKMLRQEQCKHLTGERVLEITEGRYGCAVPLEMLQDLAEEHDVSVDVADFEHRLEKSKEQQNTAPLTAREVFSHSCFETLQQRDVLPTDDSFKYIYSSTQSGYDFSALDNIPCKVVGLVQGSDIIPATVEDTEVAVILDKTCFYAEGGGQAADVGVLVSESGRFEVKDVRQYHGYIVHFGKQVQGTLCEGQQVQPVLRQTERVECMRNHTATHLLQAALRKHLGQSVTQQGSNVRADRLTFDFLCLEKLSPAVIDEVETTVRQAIKDGLSVHRQQLPLQEVLGREDVVTVPNEEYPAEVTLKVSDEFLLSPVIKPLRHMREEQNCQNCARILKERSQQRCVGQQSCRKSLNVFAR